MYPRNRPEDRAGVRGLSPQITRRWHPREDNLRRPVSQATYVHENSQLRHPYDMSQPWPSWEPRVRMDIMTAVQIASLSDQPLGLVELLKSRRA